MTETEKQEARREGRAGPLLVALSIGLVLGALFAVRFIDHRFNPQPPLPVNASMSMAEYSDHYDKRRYEQAFWSMEHTRRAFEWNSRSTHYIFWASMFITFSGVVFAFWQFSQAGKFDQIGAERDEVEIKTEMASLSFKTRSVATLVLMVSVIYLMIYTAFLYPIRNVPDSKVIVPAAPVSPVSISEMQVESGPEDLPEGLVFPEVDGDADTGDGGGDGVGGEDGG